MFFLLIPWLIFNQFTIWTTQLCSLFFFSSRFFANLHDMQNLLLGTRPWIFVPSSQSCSNGSGEICPSIIVKNILIFMNNMAITCQSVLIGQSLLFSYSCNLWFLVWTWTKLTSPLRTMSWEQSLSFWLWSSIGGGAMFRKLFLRNSSAETRHATYLYDLVTWKHMAFVSQSAFNKHLLR